MCVGGGGGNTFRKLIKTFLISIIFNYKIWLFQPITEAFVLKIRKQIYRQLWEVESNKFQKNFKGIPKF